MKVTEKKKDGLSRQFNVVLPAEKMQTQIDARLEEIGKTAKIPGFRPGKVPMPILKQRYGENVRGEALEKTLQTATMEVIKDKKLKPAMQPKVEIVRFEDNNEIEYSIQVEEMPEFEPSDLTKIKVEKLVKAVDDKEVNDALDRIAESNKQSEAIKEKRAAKKGDVLLINFDGSVNGEKKPGMQADDYELELGSGSFIDTFEDQLTGKKAGDHVTVNVTFPKDYAAKDLAGQKAVFEVDVKEIRKPVKPKIDDEFAKTLGMESLDNLKEGVKAQISREYEQFTHMKLKRALLDELDKANKFDVPEGMVKDEYEQIWQQHLNDVKSRELDVEQAEKDEDTKKEFRQIAERRVRLGLLLSEIGQREKIEVSREELNNALMQQASRYPGQQEQIFQYYQSNPQAVETLRAPLYEEKVIDFILSKADVKEKEVDMDTLMSDPDDEKEEKKKAPAKKKASSKKKAS